MDGETLRLVDDGTVEIAMMARQENGTVQLVRHRLRRPTLGELASIIELTEQGDAKLNDLNAQEQPTTTMTARPDSPYAEALRRALALLANATVSPDDMPAWAGGPQAATACVGHWRTVPLDHGTPTPSEPTMPVSTGAPQSAGAARLASALRPGAPG